MNADSEVHASLRTRIEALIAEAAGQPNWEEQDHSVFDALARDVLVYQATHLEPVGRLFAARGVDPLDLEDWRAAPPVPTSAFRSTDLHIGEVERVFRSSGTTQGQSQRSSHHHGDLELYRSVIDASFPRYCLEDWNPGDEERARACMLSLIPPAAVAPESSLAFMVEHVLERFSRGDSRYAFGAGGLHPKAATEWLREQAEAEHPLLILGTAIALWDLCIELETAGVAFQLGERCAVFETGGFKTSAEEVERTDLVSRIESGLGVPGSRVVREYGMTELTSQAYSEVLRGKEEPDRFVAPPWVRVDVLDPQTLERLPSGEEGLVAVCDLGNLSSAAWLLTEDLAVGDAGGGFELRGRARGADLRGCSLLGEQLRMDTR